MDLNEVQNATARFFTDANAHLNRIPGSAIAVRYIKSSYQNDPVRSAIELFLFLFAVRYLLAPKYSTQKKVQLTDAVCFALPERGREACMADEARYRRLTNSSTTGHRNRSLHRLRLLKNWTMRRGPSSLGMAIPTLSSTPQTA